MVPWATAGAFTNQVADHMKIALVTFTADTAVAKKVPGGHRAHVNFNVRAKDFKGLTEITIPNKESYAVGHGYAFVDASASVDASRPASWSKIPAVLSQLNSGQHDWVFYVDADAVITNFDISVEALLPARGTEGPDLIIAKDAGGYNAGVWLIRNCTWSRTFLSRWWDMKSFIRHDPGDTKSGDNDALKSFLANMGPDEFQKHVGVAPQCAFNSYLWHHSIRNWLHFFSSPGAVAQGLWHKGDFLLHLAGVPHKIAALRRFMRRNGPLVLPHMVGEEGGRRHHNGHHKGREGHAHRHEGGTGGTGGVSSGTSGTGGTSGGHGKGSHVIEGHGGQHAGGRGAQHSQHGRGAHAGGGQHAGGHAQHQRGHHGQAVAV